MVGEPVFSFDAICMELRARQDGIVAGHERFDVACVDQFRQVLRADGFHAPAWRGVRQPEEAAVMAQADVLRARRILPDPVEAGQLAVMRIFRGDGISHRVSQDLALREFAVMLAYEQRNIPGGVEYPSAFPLRYK